MIHLELEGDGDLSSLLRVISPHLADSNPPLYRREPRIAAARGIGGAGVGTPALSRATSLKPEGFCYGPLAIVWFSVG